MIHCLKNIFYKSIAVLHTLVSQYEPFYHFKIQFRSLSYKNNDCRSKNNPKINVYWKKTQLKWNCFDEDISADILIGDVILPFRDQNNFKRPKINWFDLILKNTNSRFD